MARHLAHIGAAIYVLWGVLHVVAAIFVAQLAQSLSHGVVQARVYQDAFLLAFLAVVVIFVAVFGTWRNERTAYWVNLAASSGVDVPFILFLVVPGYVTGPPALLGPGLWILAVVFSTVARRALAGQITGVKA